MTSEQSYPCCDKMNGPAWIDGRYCRPVCEVHGYQTEPEARQHQTSELRPVALMHTHDDEFTEFEEYRNGSGCLTQADKDAGWTETPLYTLEAVRAEQAAELAKFKALAATLAGALEPFAEEWDEREFLAQRHWSFYREASKAIAEYKEARNVAD